MTLTTPLSWVVCHPQAQLLWATYVYRIWRLFSPVTKIGKATQNTDKRLSYRRETSATLINGWNIVRFTNNASKSRVSLSNTFSNCHVLTRGLSAQELLVSTRCHCLSLPFAPFRCLVKPFGASVNCTSPSAIVYSVVCVILDLAVFVEFQLVTDRRTDRHTMTAYTALA